MSLRNYMTYRQVIWLLSIAMLVLHVSSTRETNKPGKLGKYCYKNFIAAWRECCGGRFPSCRAAALASVQASTNGRKKRFVIEDSPFQPPWKAKNFLARRHPRSNAMTGATEECCNEQCSLKEIAEYPCF